MSESLFLTIRSGGRRLGFPMRAVRGIKTWQEPVPLVKGAPWLLGVLAGEGQVLPVLTPSFWGGDGQAPEVNLFLDLGGRSLAVPGSEPTVTAAGVAAGEGGEEEFLSGILRHHGAELFLVDVQKLYSALGLGYNEVRLG